MNINTLKENENSREVEASKIKMLQQEAKDKFYEFMTVSAELGNKINARKKEVSDKLVNEVKDYFVSNGFNISENSNSLIFTYKELSVILKPEEDYIFSFKIEKERIYGTIEIREENKAFNMVCWKNIIRDNNNIIEFSNYDAFFNGINDIEKLHSLIILINENILHYKNTILKFDTIKYIYSLYDSRIESNSFKELFEEHISKKE